MERALREKLSNGRFDALPVHSRLMSRVRSTGNKSTECRLRFALVQSRVSGWMMHPKHLPGRPDFYFARERLAVFVDGCFWHGCSACWHRPRKNNSYWVAKIERNKARDLKSTRALRRQGISVLRFWEHDLAAGAAGCVALIMRRLQGCARR